MNWIFRENSLDAIRLFAAAQVAVLHVCEFMFAEKTGTFFFEILRLFPGVPIFFFVSGYLISKSYESTPSLLEYGKNRVLRLYPALIVCVLLNIIMVWSTGYLDGVSLADIGLLFVAKVSFIQFYNPDFMRAFGDGVLNGSLWTICVELQFYFLTPILYTVFGRNKKIGNAILIALILFFLVANRMLFIWRDEYSSEIVWKLYRVSFAPWIYLFLTGMLFQRNYTFFAKWISKIPAWLMVSSYTIIAYLLTQYVGLETGNEVSPILFVFVVLLIFRMCYHMPLQVNKLMKGNDISYGIYIWHMPIVNQMLFLNYRDNYTHALIAISLSVVLSILSWKLIEKPALKLKKFTLNKQLRST